MTFAQQLTLVWKRFSPLEERLIAAVRGVLPPEVQSTFDAQTKAVNRVQRGPEWTEIAFYRLRRGRPDWRGVPPFPRTNEFPLAEVRFGAGGRKYKSRLTCIGGHVFDFATTPSPRDVAFLDWEGEPHVRLVESPLDPAAPTPVEPVPDAWKRFLSHSRPSGGDWALHEPADVHRVTLEEGEFLLLAERAGRDFLLYRVDPPPGAYFVQLGPDARPESLRGDVGVWTIDLGLGPEGE